MTKMQHSQSRVCPQWMRECLAWISFELRINCPPDLRSLLLFFTARWVANRWATTFLLFKLSPGSVLFRFQFAGVMPSHCLTRLRLTLIAFAIISAVKPISLRLKAVSLAFFISPVASPLANPLFSTLSRTSHMVFEPPSESSENASSKRWSPVMTLRSCNTS